MYKTFSRAGFCELVPQRQAYRAPPSQGGGHIGLDSISLIFLLSGLKKIKYTHICVCVYMYVYPFLSSSC